MTGVVLAVDLGGTKTAVALADQDARILATATAPTPGSEGPAAIVATIARLAAELTPAPVRGIGVGTAGVVDAATGTIVSSTDTLVGWAGTPLAEAIRSEVGPSLTPDAVVHVQNDVDAHAWGEFRFGAAAGAGSALIVAVGTGVGGGVILDGRPWRGAHHVAGEIAHAPTPGAEGLRCTCGRLGHLEAIGSGLGIHRRYLALGGDPVVADARRIADLAARGNALADRAITEAAAAVGRAISAAVTVIDPERVVLTGGVPDIGDRWWAPMHAAYLAEVIEPLQGVPIVPGMLGGEAPLRGVAASVWERIGGMS